MARPGRGEEHAAHTACSVQAAEFAVRSSIAVREQHKAKLRALVQRLAPPTWTTPVSRPRAHLPDKPTTRRRKSAAVQLPAIPQGQEIHVLGDLMLLMRAASVDVVERVQVWRSVVHGGKPRPYLHEHDNYLLLMCEDLDFLDQAVDVVEWLGFRLARNPLIVREALDETISRHLQENVQDARTLKYWSSAAWRRSQNASPAQNPTPEEMDLRAKAKVAWRRQPPPQPLVKPLISILPEDDVVDGSRIAAAQEVLLEEESLHGRLRALKAAAEYVARGASTFEQRGEAKNIDRMVFPTVYDAIAAVNARIKRVGVSAALLRRERGQVTRMVQDLHNQVKWTEWRRCGDLTGNSIVWKCRDVYRQQALKTHTKLEGDLQGCLTALDDQGSRLEHLLDKDKRRMTVLRAEKDKQRAAKHEEKQREEVARREGIRQKSVERSRMIRAHKRRESNKGKTYVDSPSRTATVSGRRRWRPNSTHRDEYENQEELVDVESDVHALTTGDPRSAEDAGATEDVALALESKRQLAIERKRARREQRLLAATLHKLELERRRAANVAMKLEDALSSAAERRARAKVRMRAERARLERLASCAMFKCMHEMNGKRFLVSVYHRNARGYEQEGLRIVAYEPSSSAVFTLMMSRREFNSLGYGRTSDGLAAFCKWLCLLYEKRWHHFRLVWSGTPCPPPLRVHEDDELLVCVHKEGVNMRRSTLVEGYSLVAVYLRTDECSTLWFVVSAWKNDDSLLTEHTVDASRLVLGEDLDVQWGSSGRLVIVWKHQSSNDMTTDEPHDMQYSTYSSSITLGRRVYSGEVFVDRNCFVAHIYDTNTSDYTVELAPKRGKGACTSFQNDHAAEKVVLPKRIVNPYGILLPPSSFSELLASLRFERHQIQAPEVHSSVKNASTNEISSEWKVIVLSKWTSKLAKYVRVLRLTKYACKLGTGVFGFVVVFLVQQKSEFRAHLLFELTWFPPVLSSSSLAYGEVTRQSLRIALSDYLRCPNACRRFMVGLDGDAEGDEHEEDPRCPACLSSSSSIPPYDQSHDTAACSSCTSVQAIRLRALRDLIVHTGSISEEALELVYRGYCEVCAAMVAPIALVVGRFLSSTARALLPFLEHYFACFDCSSKAFQPDTDAEDGDADNTRKLFRHVLERDQVAVLFNADCGATVASANAFVHELHWSLYPEHHSLPFHATYVAIHKQESASDFDGLDMTDIYRDHDLLQAMQMLAYAVNQIAELSPVFLDIDGAISGDSAAAFEAYLVAEALLVEAVCVLLHPNYAWKKPRETVGASSWNKACDFLLDPRRLSAELRRCRPLELETDTTSVLEAYFCHANWPHDYSDVRPVFHGLLAFMMHVAHVRRIADERSGSLLGTANSQLGRLVTASDANGAEDSLLEPNTSVIDCSRLVAPAEEL